MKHISFIDTEVSEADNKAYDFGTVTENEDKLPDHSVCIKDKAYTNVS